MNYFSAEIKQNKLIISKKHKKVCKIFSYTKDLINLASTVAGCVSILTFASLTGIPVGIASSVATITICVITAEVKMSKSKISTKKKKHNKIVLIAKNMLDTVEVLTSKALINLNINHCEFVSIDNVPKVFSEMKKEIKK